MKLTLALQPNWKLPASWLLPLLATTLVSGFQFPGQTGPYITGVQDFEFTDTKYPSDLFSADAQGRRIMFRVWYPVCKRADLKEEPATTTTATSRAATTSAMCGSKNLGTRRRYFEDGEWEAYFGDSEPTEITQTFDLTHSYLNAPPLHNTTSDDEFPVIIYMHGFGMWVSDNTALLEEIASHGYTVFAIGSPGFSTGILYPNRDVVTSFGDYPEIDAVLDAATAPSPWQEPFSTDLQVRHDKMKQYLQDPQGGLPFLFPRLRDDMLVLADYLEQQSLSLFGTGDNDDHVRIKQLIGEEGLNQVLYMGFSLGGAGAGSAAQQDKKRAVGAINMDGGHQSMDLFGTAVNTPYMAFLGSDKLIPYYYNEFFFEPLESMGSSPTVTRVQTPEDVRHLDFSDHKHLDQSLREGVLGFTHSVDGKRLHDILADFCLGFINTYLADNGGGWTRDQSFTLFDSVEAVDVSYVAEWAAGDDQEGPTDAPSSSSSSSVLATSFGWLALVVATVSASVLAM